MVYATPALHRIFLCPSKMGDGLAGIEYTAGRMLDTLGIASCDRCSTRQGLEEIECCTFRGEQSPGWTRNFTQQAIGTHPVAVLCGPIESCRIGTLPECFAEPGGATQHGILAYPQI